MFSADPHHPTLFTNITSFHILLSITDASEVLEERIPNRVQSQNKVHSVAHMCNNMYHHNPILTINISLFILLLCLLANVKHG